MRAIDKMVEWLEKHPGFEVPMAPSGVMAIWREDTLRVARRLAAEEKSGDEGLREDKKEMGVWCPTCYEAIKSSERRPDGDSICVNGHKHKTGEFLVGYAPSHLTPKEAPTPSRTGELVKRLRGIAKRACMDGNGDLCVREDIENAIRDFEGGA